MIRDDDYTVIAQKFLTAAQHEFTNSEVFEFTIYGVFDTEEQRFLIIVEINNEDENKLFMFTLEQAKKFVPNLAFSLQFTSDEMYQRFAQLTIKDFSAAITAIEKANKSEMIKRYKD